MMRDDRDSYLKFWRSFGRILKEGVSLDPANRERLASLLLFESSSNPEALFTLAEYVQLMKPDQQEIFYLTGESRAAVERSPHLEAFAERDIEVLFMTDPVDELAVQALTEYDGKPLRSVAMGTVDLGSEEEQAKTREELAEKGKELDQLLKTLADHLAEHVKEVRLSSRLTSSPACLVGSEHDISPQLERLLRSSPYAVPKQKRILELNPSHAIVQRLGERYQTNREDPLVADTADLLLGYALLAEGSELPDATRFNALVVELMSRSL
jgi:molecular chaperone HtpG